MYKNISRSKLHFCIWASTHELDGHTMFAKLDAEVDKMNPSPIEYDCFVHLISLVYPLVINTTKSKNVEYSRIRSMELVVGSPLVYPLMNLFYLKGTITSSQILISWNNMISNDLPVAPTVGTRWSEIMNMTKTILKLKKRNTSSTLFL